MGRGINSRLIKICPGGAQNMTLASLTHRPQRRHLWEYNSSGRMNLPAVYAAKDHCTRRALPIMT